MLTGSGLAPPTHSCALGEAVLTACLCDVVTEFENGREVFQLSWLQCKLPVFDNTWPSRELRACMHNRGTTEGKRVTEAGRPKDSLLFILVPSATIVARSQVGLLLARSTKGCCSRKVGPN